MTGGSRARVLVASGALALTVPAFAHDATVGAGGAHWTLDAWVVLPILGSGCLYAIGALRLRQRAGHWQPRRAWEAAAYCAGWLGLVGALLSPLHWLGEHLFTFHMIEHEILMAAAAPFLVLARPAGVLLWALPAAWRRGIGTAARSGLATTLWTWATRPRNATVLHGLAIWLWHVPAVFDAAVVDATLHRLQHLSFLLTALLFWWSMLRRSRAGVAVWHLFVTMIHTSVLGALLALSPRVLYHVQTADAPGFGLTPLEDQQLAGVIMWVPAETVYAGAALALLAFWIMRPGREGPARLPGVDEPVGASP